MKELLSTTQGKYSHFVLSLCSAVLEQQVSFLLEVPQLSFL